MRRRAFTGFMLGVIVAPANQLRAQAKPVVIGLLHSGARDALAHRIAGLKQGLAALGWKEGADIVFEERWADGRVERLPDLAKELATKNAAVFVTGGSPPVAAAIKATPRIPVVMATIGDPVASGFVASIARPGGMITGLTSISANITEKYLELLLTVSPKLRRIGFLFDPTVLIAGVHMETARRSGAQQGVEIRHAEATRPAEIEQAMARLAEEGAEALVIMPSTIFAADRKRIVGLALARRWPAVAQTREYAESGALLSYGADPTEQYRRAAYFVDRILKGAKPGDLPIEQPTKYELTVNLKTATALGLTVPQSILVSADRVIE